MAPKLLAGTVGWAIDNGDLLVEVWGSRIGVELFEETMRCLVISVLKTEVCLVLTYCQLLWCYVEPMESRNW